MSAKLDLLELLEKKKKKQNQICGQRLRGLEPGYGAALLGFIDLTRSIGNHFEPQASQFTRLCIMEGKIKREHQQCGTGNMLVFLNLYQSIQMIKSTE